jgi:hypothetical protein
MNKSLAILFFQLALLCAPISSWAQPIKIDGPLHIVKDPNIVFYLGADTIPSDISITYVETLILDTFEEFNAIENTTFSLTYGGAFNDICRDVYVPDGPPPDPAPDPDRDVICFTDNAPTAAGTTEKKYIEGQLHERSWIAFNPDNPKVRDYDRFRYVMAHELSHVFGVGHVPYEIIEARGFEGDSVLCIGPRGCSENNRLSPYDIDQLQALYPVENEKHPEYPRHCVQWVNDTDGQKHGKKNDYTFYHLVFEGKAYDVLTTLDVEKLRFDVDIAAVNPVTYEPGRDCTGLELINGEIHLPYIIYEHFIFELILKIDEDDDGLHLDIVSGSEIYPGIVNQRNPSGNEEQPNADQEVPQAENYISFVIGSEVSPDIEEQIISVASGTEKFLRSLDFPFSGIPMHAYANYDSLLAAYAEINGIDVAAADLQWEGGNVVTNLGNQWSLFFNLSSQNWTELDDVDQALVMAQEIFRVLQFQQRKGQLYTDGDQVPTGGPVWLREGSKKLIGLKAVDSQEKLSFESNLESSVDALMDNSYNLAEMETQNGFSAFDGDEVYLSLVAANFLSQDLIKFIEFYSAIGNGLFWQDAFTQTFGKTVAVYYEEFAMYQSDGYQN